MKIEDRIIFSAIMGSRAWGLHDEQSDVDSVEIWVGPPIMSGTPDVVVRNIPGVDGKLLEIRHVAAKLISGDLNVVELLHARDKGTSRHFQLFEPGVATKFITESWRRRVLSFGKKLLLHKDAPKPKEIVHAYRVLTTALHFLRTGAFENDLRQIVPLEIEELKAIKRGQAPLHGLRERAVLRLDLVERFGPIKSPAYADRYLQACIAEILEGCWVEEDESAYTSFISPVT